MRIAISIRQSPPHKAGPPTFPKRTHSPSCLSSILRARLLNPLRIRTPTKTIYWMKKTDHPPPYPSPTRGREHVGVPPVLEARAGWRIMRKIRFPQGFGTHVSYRRPGQVRKGTAV